MVLETSGALFGACCKDPASKHLASPFIFRLVNRNSLRISIDTALPDGWYPFAGHDQFRADGNSCKKTIEIRKLHAVIRRMIGHQKLVQFIDPFGGKPRYVYHEEVPMWLVRWLRTFL